MTHSLTLATKDMGRQDNHVFENSDVVTFPDFINEKEMIQKKLSSSICSFNRYLLNNCHVCTIKCNRCQGRYNTFPLTLTLQWGGLPRNYA